MEMCPEFDGDYFKFAKKYVKFEWINGECSSDFGKCTQKTFESRVCTPDEITQVRYNSDRLYICPPIDQLSLLNNFEYNPSITIGFTISTNYEIVKDKKEVQSEIRNFWIAREQRKS